LPFLGYSSIKQGAQLWCILLFYDDFVGHFHGFKFYLEYILDELLL